MLDSKLRLIVLNTNYYFNNNGTSPYSSISDPVGQFSWFSDTLAKSNALGQKVLIIGHVPPGVYGRSVYNITEKRWFFDSFNEQYIAIIRSYCSTIIGQLFGHEHEGMCCKNYKVTLNVYRWVQIVFQGKFFNVKRNV